MALKDSPSITECEQSRTFYVVSHGWHTGIIISRRDFIEMVPELAKDFDSGTYLEFGWGDERFYQAENVTIGLTLRAALWPTPSVLHVASIPKTPESTFPQSEIVELSVPHSGHQELLAFVASRFRRTPENRIIRLGPGLYSTSGFYRAEGDFHALNTCNTWVAEAIGKTGYPISSTTVIRAEGVMSQLRERSDTDLKCFSVRPLAG